MAAHRSFWLLGAVVLIVVIPLMMGGEFSGTDDQASQVIEKSQPGYQPWFTPLWRPPSSEIESLLFALQAALGAGVIGYVIGRRHGQTKDQDADRSPSDTRRTVK
ncbi:energy-coupling factor ABC transporter substrate-binding protein [Oryzibacter oryziterrae]|uniref:energy-coupling factor ABC transporter substrate-binding protein n=1 Tax=Oryzibacter oryziterrae TaxID=2766474 RepID=UPI001F014A7A|nr:energy-coupling factor ABC transporter substrate-binding protein [Oryzibacter oryziterrae]